ncbi:4'-phosphopantetheinyl transferase superfamily protein [Psychroserpens sp.]|uniref:4'-phosphopantetheinyl transferase superfamily protein n=1 Tax=Psychroserpens sp. TaxID=2020870 RepID=UPI003C72155A
MIGNDIVDLKQAAQDSPDSYREGKRYQRFLDKVFTQNEQALIFSSENHYETVWLFWSMKEAAYKVHVQQFGKRFFNPKRLVCKLISEEKGIVSIDDHHYFTSSTVTKDYVYTVAKLNLCKPHLSTIIASFQLCSIERQSKMLKIAFLTSVSKTKEMSLRELQIKKTAIGVPKLIYNNRDLPTSFSLTHCGRFSGFAY